MGLVLRKWDFFSKSRKTFWLNFHICFEKILFDEVVYICSLCSISVNFFTHAHIHDCVHVIKFVTEEICETALWKAVFKSRQVFGT